uniref:Uncharacterized protein n=1 Tax=Auxenochlorella protothecoides TaxID=3075 RepID=A0A1D1ZVU1_AUXPR
MHSWVAAMQSFSLVKAKRVPRTLLQCEDSDEEPQPSTGPETIGAAVDHLALGNEAAEKEEYSLALRHWEEGLREGSDAPHVLHEQMSQVLIELDRPLQAAKQAELAVEAAPKWAEAHLTLGRARLCLRDWPLARGSFAQALHFQPDHAMAKMELEELDAFIARQETRLRPGPLPP